MDESSTGVSPAIRRWSVAGCVVVYAAAFVMTHLPPNRVPGAGLINDKILHCTGYCGLGLALLWTLAVRRRWHVGPMLFFGAWVAILGYALFDESTQPIVGRDFEWGDVAADAIGSLIGIVIAVWIVRWRKQRNESC